MLQIIIGVCFYILASFIIILHSKKRVPKNWVLLCFAIYLAINGTVYLSLFFHDIKLIKLLLLLTTIVSILMVIIYPIFAINILKYHNPIEYEALIQQLHKKSIEKHEALETLNTINIQLQVRLDHMDELIRRKGWVDEKELDLTEMREMIKYIKIRNGHIE